jgi:hypothetical protein
MTQSFEQYLAASLVKGTRRKFSRLHADFLEIRMSETTNNMNVQTQVPAPIAKPVDRKTIEGSYPGDSRSQARPAAMPPNPAPRAQTNDELEGVGG